MGVNRDVTRLGVETERVWFPFQEFFDELFEEMAALRDRLGIGQLQLAIILDEHRVAGWFEEQNGRVRIRSAKKIEIMPPHFASRIEIALAERRPAAAFPVLHQRNLKSKHF